MTVGRGAVFKTNDSNKTPTPMGVHVAEQLSKNVNGHSRAVIQKREPTAIAASIRKVFGRFHPGAVPPWRCSTLALLHPGAAPPWRCSTLALLHPGAAQLEIERLLPNGLQTFGFGVQQFLFTGRNLQ